MEVKNTGKRLLCLLLAVCSILANINFNRLEIRAEVNEKKLYMDYLAKIDKKWQKKVKQDSKDDPYRKGYGYVYYKFIDLDDDGRKELLYRLWEDIYNGQEQLFVCTIKNGKIHKVWKSLTAHAVGFSRVKGEKKKWVVDYLAAVGSTYHIYTFSSEKMKKMSEYYAHTDFEPGGSGDYCYYDENDKKCEQPSELRDNNLKRIFFKEYK